MFDLKFQILGFVVIFQRGSSNDDADDDDSFFLRKWKIWYPNSVSKNISQHVANIYRS